MKIELEINKQDFLKIVKYYFEGYQKDLNIRCPINRRIF